MDPLEVIRRIWQQRWLALPALLLAIGASVAVYFLGPREYQASASYAIVNPQIPTADQIKADPELGKLNSNNPYLRSSDPALVGNVVITRLNSQGTADLLQQQGLGTDFTAEPGVGNSGSIVAITASGTSPRQALSTIDALGTLFQQTLRNIQTVDGASDRYLFTSLEIAPPDHATEKLSSRLRTVIVVAVGGVILIFAAVSLGTWRDAVRRRRREAAAAAAEEAAADVPEPAQEPEFDEIELLDHPSWADEPQSLGPIEVETRDDAIPPAHTESQRSGGINRERRPSARS